MPPKALSFDPKEEPVPQPITLDLDFARRCFPPVVWDWAFFENAGGTFVP